MPRFRLTRSAVSTDRAEIESSEFLGLMRKHFGFAGGELIGRGEVSPTGTVVTHSAPFVLVAHDWGGAVAWNLANQLPQLTKKLAIISTKGTLDWAYPPLILATTAASLGWDVGVFFTFYGLNIIHKEKGKHMKVAESGS